MTEHDVELTRVTKTFAEVVAVDDVSFGIRKGEFFSLLGPSGCGKTTIMRMISGFETPTKGTITIAGEDMRNRPPFRRPTNLVFQHLALFPHMTVEQNIAFGLEMQGGSKAEIARSVGQMLDLIQLPEYGKRRIGQLSGGQKQRVAIARALVRQPTVLLLDEPLGALDLKLREQMQLELKRIQREVGTTFVYVTHDQKEAITMSNSIAVMNAGVIEQIGDANEIYENPRTAFVAHFIGETNLFEGKVDAMDGGEITVGADALAIRVPGNGVSTGQKVSVSVRPEKVVLGEAARELPNRYDGKVEDVIYQGSSTSYQIRLDGGRLVTVMEQNVERGEPRHAGASVTIGWRPDKGVLITEGLR
ncbi:MAG: ABC transporter ATP-binding protein [Ectothiorhodospiraceae bacterium]|nr:ABC transporter ATP-binding protein [Chromatiales bacterium]MCP5154338.1 ABC transporter ATP-binding protein [Ectothiorhodospiraceae bacterium]